MKERLRPLPAGASCPRMSSHAMPPTRRRLVVLGSTGSIGTNCLDVVDSPAATVCEIVGLSAHSSWDALLRAGPALSAALGRRSPTPTPPGSRRRAACRPAAGCCTAPTASPRWCSDPDVDVVVTRHRRRGGAGRHLGGPGSGQDRRRRQQGNAGHGRAAGHGPGRPPRRPAAAGRQRAQRHLPGHAGQSARRGRAHRADRQRRPVPRPDARPSWPTSPSRRPCGIRPGAWGRRSPSTRPR